MEEKEKDVAAVGIDPEATLITPLFDRDAAQTARPVVPLTESASSERGVVVAAPWQPAAPSAVRRASWPVFLIAVSALAGGLLGVLGLHFYQQGRSASTAPAAEEWESIPEASPQFTPEVAGATATEAGRAVVPASASEPLTIVEKTEETRSTSAKPAAAESRSAEPRPAPAESAERAGRGEEDERRVERKPRRTESDQAASVREDEPGPRRIDRIRDIMGGRPRSGRRRDNGGQATPPQGGSIRDIFEGQPPR